jgi:hypothetical protein
MAIVFARVSVWVETMRSGVTFSFVKLPDAEIDQTTVDMAC